MRQVQARYLQQSSTEALTWKRTYQELWVSPNGFRSLFVLIMAAWLTTFTQYPSFLAWGLASMIVSLTLSFISNYFV